MSDLQRVGSVYGNAGTAAPFTSGISGAQRTQDAHGRYMDAVIAGRVFYLSAAAAAPTAYVGAAAGTPLIAIHNPTNSGKYISVLGVGIAMRAAASAAGQTGLAAWAGPSVQPTGTKTPPTNAFTQSQAGSGAIGFVNTALTSSTALALALPIFTYYWATAAGAILSPGQFDVGGLLVAAPGNQIAIGLTTVPTSTTCDIAVYWEEVPALSET